MRVSKQIMFLAIAATAVSSAACGGGTGSGEALKGASAGTQTSGSTPDNASRSEAPVQDELSEDNEPAEIRPLGLNPFMGGSEVGDIASAAARAGFTPAVPGSLGQPTALYVQPDGVIPEAVGLYYENSRFGAFEVTQEVSSLTVADFEVQVEQFAKACATDGAACADGSYEMVKLGDGRLGMVSTVTTADGSPVSGGLFWLQDGLLFILQVRPPGTFDLDTVLAAAGEFVASDTASTG